MAKIQIGGSPNAVTVMHSGCKAPVCLMHGIAVGLMHKRSLHRLWRRNGRLRCSRVSWAPRKPVPSSPAGCAEHSLQKQIADVLRLEIAPPGKVSKHGVVWWSIDHANYAGVVPGIRIGRGIIAGIPDLFILYRGRAYHPEIKTEDGVMSDAQQSVSSAVLAAGGRVAIVRNANELLVCIRRVGYSSCASGETMRSGTHHAEELKLEIKRARHRAWNKNRDNILLSNERKAERAKLPARELPAKRRCLMCQWWFQSKSCGNRICHNVEVATSIQERSVDCLVMHFPPIWIFHDHLHIRHILSTLRLRISHRRGVY